MELQLYVQVSAGAWFPCSVEVIIPAEFSKVEPGEEMWTDVPQKL